ncbi:MAG: DUF6962 family protein [Bacteroidia bacterium]
MQTSFNGIHLGSFLLSEPVTALTDLLLALLCLIIIFRLRRSQKTGAASTSWSFFFAGMGLSTFTGALVHGMRAYQTDAAHYNTWMVMNVVSGLSVFFAQMATVDFLRKSGRGDRIYKTIALIQLGCFIVLILLFRNFEVVKVQVAAGMVPVMIIHLTGLRKGVTGSGWIGAGIGVSFCSAIFHTFKLSIHPVWCNFNDLSHLFIGISFVLIAKGILIESRH